MTDLSATFFVLMHF